MQWKWPSFSSKPQQVKLKSFPPTLICQVELVHCLLVIDIVRLAVPHEFPAYAVHCLTDWVKLPFDITDRLSKAIKQVFSFRCPLNPQHPPGPSSTLPLSWTELLSDHCFHSPRWSLIEVVERTEGEVRQQEVEGVIRGREGGRLEGGGV